MIFDFSLFYFFTTLYCMPNEMTLITSVVGLDLDSCPSDKRCTTKKTWIRSTKVPHLKRWNKLILNLCYYCCSKIFLENLSGFTPSDNNVGELFHQLYLSVPLMTIVFECTSDELRRLELVRTTHIGFAVWCFTCWL